MDTTDDSASNSAFEIVKTLREGNPSEPPSSTQDSIPASLILSTAKLDSIGLFTSALCSQTFTFTDRLALLDIKLDATAGFPEQLIQPSSSLLNSKGGFAETPAAILSWEDYLAACSISKPCNNPFPLLISYPLTIWHILSHVLPDMERFYAGEPLNRNKVALKNGAHVVVHIVMAEQWQVELAPLFEFLVPLIRGATIDFFVIGPELIVKPMATAGTDAEPAARDERIERTEEVADKTAPQRSLLRKAEHSIEFKSERYASCIRVHVARSTCSYPPQQGSFPIDSYPPDVVLSFGTSGKDSSPSTELRSSLRAANLPGRFVICVDSNLVSALESLQDTEAKRPKGHRAGRVWGPESNPFRQPWKRRRFDSDLPGFGNGLIWGWAC